MTRAILIAALLAATPAHARWVHYTVWQWRPDPIIRHHYLTRAEMQAELCRLNYPFRSSNVFTEARRAELACALRYGVRVQ